ncbi:PH domain-containing protein [Caldibacillus lycopersici]|uniref:PH domain-containing protein n=1 Tax=Perspicuibacillus lycopersici TaxID=1325689 RepID=A0AAE3IXG7_9BACI|nr:PH domain-containing protein [Perspicuibacillus lycopersici]MCU9615156.1 PH domain-containing protein [Perspicuibacillus lycopersici]
MIGEPNNRISKGALTVWRIHGIIGSVITLIISFTLGTLCFLFDWPVWIVYGLAVLFILEVYYFVLFRPKLRWLRWRYEVREQEIEIQHGLFVVRKTLIPMIRVQHVDNTQGPILKKFGLATVTISTAATQHEIPALEEVEAEELRHVISRLARVADEDV